MDVYIFWGEAEHVFYTSLPFLICKLMAASNCCPVKLNSAWIIIRIQFNSVLIFILYRVLRSFYSQRNEIHVKNREVKQQGNKLWVSTYSQSKRFLVGHCQGQVNGSYTKTNSATLDLHTSYITTYKHNIHTQNQTAK